MADFAALSAAGSGSVRVFQEARGFQLALHRVLSEEEWIGGYPIEES
jgi:hypothetical protein